MGQPAGAQALRRAGHVLHDVRLHAALTREETARFLNPVPRMGIDSSLKRDAHARLKRIAGQVGGIERMLDTDRDGIEVLRQVTAVQAALMETGRMLLAAHFERCLSEALAKGDAADRRKRIDELTELFVRFCKIEGGR